MRVKLKKKTLLICIVLAFLIEVLIFNMSAIFAIGNQKDVVTNTYSVEGATLNSDSGAYTIDSEQVILYAGGIVKDISDLYLGLDFEDEIVPYCMRISDEGNTCTSYETPTQYILQWSDSSKYIRLHTYGKVLTNKIIFTVTPGKTMRINEIAYNPVRPVRIRPVRLALVFLLILGFALFGKNTNLHEVSYLGAESKARNLMKNIATLVLLLVGIVGILVLTLRCGGHWNSFAYMSEYADLADALSKGHYYLDYEVSDALAQAENPYDYTYRDVNQVQARWDTAYYNGHYYCYFGITPVLLLYLPYHLLTGLDLNNVTAALIFSILIWLGATWLMRECIERFYPEVPYWFWAATSILLGFNVQLVYLYQRPDMYDVPILAGNALLFLGLACWLHSLRSNKRSLFMFLGSLSVALLAGCRPQMVLTALLAIPIFYELLVQKTEARATNWKKYGIVILVPFIIFAVFIMQYNYARFGSVFDFGANYNLTTNDMTKRGFHIDRLGSGLFSFLLQLPSLLSIYPFMIRSNVATEYMGKTIAENIYGGVFATNIICWILFLGRYMKGRLKTQGSKLLVMMCCGIGFILCCIDATVAGVLQRYMADFVGLFLIPSIIMIGVLISDFWKQKRNLYYIMAMICWVAVLIVGLMDFGVVCIQLREYDADNTTRILYHELRSYFVLQ